MGLEIILDDSVHQLGSFCGLIVRGNITTCQDHHLFPADSARLLLNAL